MSLTKDQTLFQTLEQHSVGTQQQNTSGPLRHQQKEQSLSFPKIVSLCETSDHTKLMTTWFTLSQVHPSIHPPTHPPIFCTYCFCVYVVSVIRFLSLFLEILLQRTFPTVIN